MIDDDREFNRRVAACAAEMDDFVPRLMMRYSPVAVMAAMAEHVGGALMVLMHERRCTPEEARKILQHATKLALRTADVLSGPDLVDEPPEVETH